MNAPAGPPITLRYRFGLHPLPASDSPQMVYTLLEITAAGLAGGGAPLPLNLCLVLDASLSMQGEKMARLREAARYVVRQLGFQDALAVVAFNDRATTVVPTQLNRAPDAIYAALAGIVPRGGTELATGLQAGLEELRRGLLLTGPAISSLLVLTDGRTYGDEAHCAELAEQARQQGLLITALGVGTEWNEDLLETIALRSGSHSEYLAAPSAIVDAFRQHVGDLRKIWARQLQLTAQPGPGVRLAHLHRIAPLLERIERLPDVRAGEHAFALGTLLADEPQALLLEMAAPPLAEGPVVIAVCALDWQAADSRATGAKVRYTIAASVGPPSGAPRPLDPLVMQVVEKVSAFKLQQRALQDLWEGRVAQATSKLYMVATRLLGAGEPELAAAVRAEAEHLERHGFLTETGIKRIKYGTRGLGRTRAMRAAAPGSQEKGR